MVTRRFTVEEMNCSSCAGYVERAVGALDGLDSITVNILTNTLTVTYDDLVLDETAIVAAVSGSGYTAVPRSEPGSRTVADLFPSPDLETRLDRRFILSLSFSIPLVILSLLPHIDVPFRLPFERGYLPLALALTQLLLVLPVLIANGPTFVGGFSSLLRRRPNMESLVALGAAAAFVEGVVSLYMIALGGVPVGLCFESTGLILTLTTLGKLLEAKAKKSTTEAIRRLVDMRQDVAVVLKDGKETRVHVSDIAIGDILVVHPGQHIPVDGIVIEGHSTIDTSAITGESTPVEKNAGDAVWSATVNLSGSFHLRAERIGSATVLSRIIEMVEESSSSHPPISRMADRISAVFVPGVMVASLLTLIVWIVSGGTVDMALSSAISVLVISCPCALGLAAPAAIMVATGKGALRGILVKNADFFEISHSIDTVLFDKAGTVTEGKPRVTDIVSVSLLDHNELLAYAASIETPSEHPLGFAITAEAKKSGLPLLPVDSFVPIPGHGVSATIKGKEYFGGGPALLEKNGVDVTELMPHVKRLSLEGKTAFCFGSAEEPLGIIAVADVLKAGSREAVSKLKDMGLEVILLTGDNHGTADFIRTAAGIDRSIVAYRPEDKAEVVRKLKAVGHRVAVVGDGINDAPALAEADLGIVLGSGTDLVIDSADIVLVGNSLDDVVTALKLGRAVMTNIRQNFFWAMIYNALGIPLAAGVLYSLWGLSVSPMIAAAAMSASSLSVVLNALRLKSFDKE